MEGYVKLYRSSLKDPLYMKEAFTKWQAWCDLILIAYHTPTDIFVRNVKVKAKRSCVYMSVADLAERWRWSRGKVDRFLKYLEDDMRIKVKVSNIVNCIAIVNYEKFQQPSQDERTNGATNRASNGATNGHNRINDNNDNILLFPASPESDTGEGVLQQILSQMQELKDRLDAQEQPKPEKKTKKKEPNPLIVEGRKVFEKRYADLFSDSYYWQAKDAAAMDALTKKIIYSRQQKGMSVEVEDVLKALGALLESVQDAWILKNFSVTNINSKYNEIVAQARAAKNNSNQDGTDKRRSSEVTATSAEDYKGAF